MNRWRKWLLGGLIVWIALVAWWAVTPITDTVPTGSVPNKDKVPVPTVQAVACDSPLSGNTSPTGGLPVLRPPRAYSRTPCKLPHQNDRIIFAIDVVLVVGVLIVLIKTWKPASEVEPSELAATTTA